MSNDEFFVIGCTADGTTFDGPISSEMLKTRLLDNYYGQTNKFATKNPGTDGFCIKLDDGELLIIRGRIIVPKTKHVATEYEL